MPQPRQRHPSYLDPSASVYDVVGSDEMGACADWREMIARVTDLCMRRVFLREGDAAQWGRPLNRQVLEDLLDVRELGPDVTMHDLQRLTQETFEEAESLHAILGAALVMAWPSSPLGFVDWPDRAIALSGLRTDRAGVRPQPIGRELRREERMRQPEARPSEPTEVTTD